MSGSESIPPSQPASPTRDPFDFNSSDTRCAMPAADARSHARQSPMRISVAFPSEKSHQHARAQAAFGAQLSSVFNPSASGLCLQPAGSIGLLHGQGVYVDGDLWVVESNDGFDLTLRRAMPHEVERAKLQCRQYEQMEAKQDDLERATKLLIENGYSVGRDGATVRTR